MFAFFKKHLTGCIVAGVLAVGGIATAATTAKSNTTQTNSAKTSQPATSTQPQITTKTVTETEPIPYSSSNENDSTLAKGQTKVKIAGVNGEKAITYEVKYQNGQQISKTETGETITKQPVNEVLSIGTYVAPAPQPTCSNGSYANSSGNTVCSPSATNTGGATAICGDGSYSHSESRRGTCSHHGGVSQRL
ncbi:MAG: G5 domain-containing protein [Candidatus Nomurabacteria bacterium]|jgi:hypothetical protein|nr:G5 domain-containing protein [Candidatus Nomurabacteria bacterium]